jgi:hypothetical protein
MTVERTSSSDTRLLSSAMAAAKSCISINHRFSEAQTTVKIVSAACAAVQHQSELQRTSTREEDSKAAVLVTASGAMQIAARGADAGAWLENLARRRARLPCTVDRSDMSKALRGHLRDILG